MHGYGNLDGATESTLAKRFGGNHITTGLAISTNGDNTIVSPSATNKKLRVYWVYLNTSENNSSEVLATLKFGASGPTIYKTYLGAPGAFSHWEQVDGGTGLPLIINLSGSQGVNVNLTYDEMT